MSVGLIAKRIRQNEPTDPAACIKNAVWTGEEAKTNPNPIRFHKPGLERSGDPDLRARTTFRTERGDPELRWRCARGLSDSFQKRVR
jgi:hypothetical protein